MKNRGRFNSFLSRAAILAAAGMTIGAAHADDVINFEGYTPGSLIGKVDPGNGNTWQLESPTEWQPAVIVTGVNSPMDAGNTAVEWMLQAPSDNTTLHGLDLSHQYNSGVVEVSYDFYMGDNMNDRTGGGAGRNVLRPRLLNKPIASGAGNTGTGADGSLLFISYPRQQAFEKYGNLNTYSSANNGAFGFQDDVHGRNSQVFSAFGVTPSAWHRVKHYFDYSDPTNPGHLLYSVLYDINGGVERRIAERRPDQQPILEVSTSAAADAAGSGIAAIQLELNTAAFLNAPNQTFYLDNFAVRQLASFTPPASMDQLPPPTARPPQQTTRSQAASVRFDFAASGFSSPGATPGMEAIGNDLYTYDATNNLLHWDLTGATSPSFMGTSSNFSNDQMVGTMTSSADGTKLYFTSTGLAGEWGALYVYDIATQSDGGIPVYDSFARNYGDGEHSAARVSIPGETDRVVAAWRGAQFFDAYPADGVSAAGGIGGIGNRWDGACCEGDSPDTIFALFRTGHDGLRSSVPNPQGQAVQNAIYRVTYAPGGGAPLFEPVSPSLQVLPWDPACGDGPCSNTHRMVYVPQTNSIWVVRGADSNQIGVYSIDNDDWTVVNVLLPGGTPFLMNKTDIQLAGDEMLIMSEGEVGIYSISAVNLGDLPTGACCVAGSCSQQTGPDCAGMGGAFLGDGSDCDTYSAAVAAAPMEDISATGANLIAAGLGDDNEIERTLPFTFNLYGEPFTSVWIGGNGYLRFGGAQDCNNCWVNTALPSDDSINNAIYPMWFDISPQNAPGSAQEEVRGAAPNRRYIVQFTNVSEFFIPPAAPVNSNTFQVILYEADSSVEFRYGNIETANATVGVESGTGLWATSVDFATLADGASVVLTPADSCDSAATCACETDGDDNQVNVFDLLAYLDGWFAQAPAADIDGDPGVDVFDLLFYLDCWFPASAGAPCP